MDLPIQIVDEKDRPIGGASKPEARKRGLIHRVVRVMIENDKGEILLQLRVPDKDIFPNCWDNSVAGHVDVGESYDQAAGREIEEEIGLKGYALQEMGVYRSDETIDGLRFNRFTKAYKLHTNIALSELRLDPTEVSDVRWFSIDEAKQLLANHPDRVSDGLRQVLERYY